MATGSIKCSRCGTILDKDATHCSRCVADHNNTTYEDQQAAACRDMLCTTTCMLEGYKVVRTIGVVAAECVYGMNIFRDIFALARDIVGGRSKASQNILKDARIECLDELRREAVSLGANAVIGVSLDYSEFSGGGKSMLFVVASGTAVVVEELPANHALQ